MFSTTDCKMGFGWHQTQNCQLLNSQVLQYYLPSSTKAETFAILTAALLCCPSNSTTTIYSDSANCISTFYSFIAQKSVSPRRRLKQNSHLAWLLRQIYLFKTTFSLVEKVTTHSGNLDNEKADKLAKQGLESLDPIIINHRFITSSLGFFAWNNMAIINRNVRKWRIHH